MCVQFFLHLSTSLQIGICFSDNNLCPQVFTIISDHQRNTDPNALM